ncbi:uncharacterized protein [Watersipora subatra]|uniref:uncharacterized protein n=1 Tax=Watersipora subatra TaxID=2589382 RepID=UPI00355B1731
MEKLCHDLPTLHRPVTYEDNCGADRYENLTHQLRPRPTPPHKDFSLTSQRPHTSVSYSYNQCGNGKLATLPAMLTDTNWRTRRAKQVNDELPADEEFEKSYEELASRKAYRHPHPGIPKGREGCIGGTWRHTKEAVGYGPGRLMWIDGIVTLYDDWTLNNEKPWSGRRSTEHQTRKKNEAVDRFQGRRFIPQRQAVPIIDNTDRWYASNRPQPLLSTEPPVMSAPLGKHKGFYSMAQAYS